MFSKLTQLKNFIGNAMNALARNRPLGPNDAQLSDKLHFYLDFILKNEQAMQFKAYQQLQSELGLNELLRSIYLSPLATTEDMVAIIHFITFLLTNSANQFVLCKIVSDQFVVSLTRIIPDKPAQQPIQHGQRQSEPEHTSQQTRAEPGASIARQGVAMMEVDMEEINAYKTALIKAYISRVDAETIKYMIVDDCLPVLDHCIAAYTNFTAGNLRMGVETTCIANAILLMLRHISGTGYACKLSQYFGSKANRLVTTVLAKLAKFTGQLLAQKREISEEHHEIIESSVEFLVDIKSAVTQPEDAEQLVKSCAEELLSVIVACEMILDQWLVAQHHAQQLSSAETQNEGQKGASKDGDSGLYGAGVRLLRMLTKMLYAYEHEAQVNALMESRAVRLVDGLIKHFRFKLDKSVQKSLQFNDILCNTLEIIARMLQSSHCSLSKRQPDEPNPSTSVLLVKLNTLLEMLTDQSEMFATVCYKSIKMLLLSLLQLVLAGPSVDSLQPQSEYLSKMHVYSLLKLFICSSKQFRQLLRPNDNWQYIVMNYEGLMRGSSDTLLSTCSSNSQSSLEYSYCSTHSNDNLSARSGSWNMAESKSSSSPECIRNGIMLYECVRNYRFMMVEATYIENSLIKQEKIYHKNFVTKGWGYQPGTSLDLDYSKVCEMSLNTSNNIHKLPVEVVEDEECLILVAQSEEGQAHQKNTTVVMNIRYKSIYGFVEERQCLIRVKLKGLQEIVLEAKNPKDCKKFKEYLIARKDKARQKELKFIHYYLNMYEQDVLRLVEELGTQDIIQELGETHQQSSSQEKETRQEQGSRQDSKAIEEPEQSNAVEQTSREAETQLKIVSAHDDSQAASVEPIAESVWAGQQRQQSSQETEQTNKEEVQLKVEQTIYTGLRVNDGLGEDVMPMIIHSD